MAKPRQQSANKKLSKNQIRRLTRNQAQKLDTCQDDWQIGQLISHVGFGAIVEVEHKTYLARWRQNLEDLATGDLVYLSFVNDEAVIEAIKPRKNCLQKFNHYKGTRAMVTNIDQMLVAATTKPVLQKSLLDRYLVMAKHLDVPMAIFFNKNDLWDDQGQQLIESVARLYASLPDVVCFFGSAQTGNGLPRLNDWLLDKKTVFIGQSGVGKSTLINALVPDLNIQTKAISESSGLGRHSTTNAALYHQKAKTDIIDTPGVRSFDVMYLGREAVIAGFPDIAPHLSRCRFSNCAHQKEKDCGLQQALSEKAICPERYASFLQMLNEADNYGSHG